MRTYRVEVVPGEKFCAIYVPAVERWTQARTPDEIPAMARDLIEIMTGVPAPDIELDLHVTDVAEPRNERKEHQERKARKVKAIREVRAALARDPSPGVTRESILEDRDADRR